MSIQLSVNLNKIALIRNSRETAIPDIMAHAKICIDAGADGITVHPRPDQRHIRADDVRLLAGNLGVEFNIEGNPFAPPMTSSLPFVSDYPGFMQLVKEARPEQCTLVPDSNEQLTSDHGFDLKTDGERLQPIIEELKAIGSRISLFMDPDPEQIRLAAQLGVDRIELYTGPYADHFGTEQQEKTLRRYIEAAEVALEENLGLNAGHDLNLDNLPMFSQVPGLLEVSIGHALVVDALSYGLGDTIRRYQKALGK